MTKEDQGDISGNFSGEFNFFTGVFEPKPPDQTTSEGLFPLFSKQKSMPMRDKIDFWFKGFYINAKPDRWVTQFYSGIAFPDDSFEDSDCEDFEDIIQFQAKVITRTALEQYSKDPEPPFMLEYPPNDATYEAFFSEDFVLKGTDEYVETALEFYQ